MNHKTILKEFGILTSAALVIGFSISMFNLTSAPLAIISMFIVITINYLSKKSFAYYLEADIEPKFWAVQQFGWGSHQKFKKPIVMVWVPILISLITKAYFFWLAIISYNIKPRTERVSRRHGLYRFTQMTDWHIAIITSIGLIANLILAVITYLIGFESFSRLNIWFALWCLIPLGDLDGSKIIFGSRGLWVSLLTFILIILSLGIVVS